MENQINKGNPFSPDIGFHAHVVLLLRAVHLRHNAPVSLAETAFKLNKGYRGSSQTTPVLLTRSTALNREDMHAFT